MKRGFCGLAETLPHAVISLALAVAVLVVLDVFNPRMGFLTSTYSRIILCLLAVFAVALGVENAVRNRRAQRRRLQNTQNERRPR